MRLYWVLPITIFLYSCGGGGGGGGGDSSPAAPSSTVSLSASPTSVLVGQNSTITWSSTNSSSCAATWTTSTSTSGTQTVAISSPGNNNFSMTCSGSGASGTSSVVIEGYRNFSGVVADGYMRGADIFVDQDNNWMADSNESSSTSDNDGKFTLRYDNGYLVSLGGTDLDTNILLDNLLLTHNLTGHTDFKVVTPITSVAAFMSNSTNINSALGIDSSININSFDPVANKGDDGINDYLYEKGNQLTVLAYALQNLTNDIKSSTDTTQDYFKAISEEIEKEFNSSAQKVDIETDAFITKVIDNLVIQKTITLTEDAKANTSASIASVLPVIEVKADNNLTTAVLRFATSKFQTDITAIANGSASTDVINSYKTDILNYIANDQSVSSDVLAPSVSAIDDSATIDEDNNAEISILNNDSYLTTAPFNLSNTNPSNGSVSISNNVATYTPNQDFNGSDSFTYTITQGDKTSTANVSITINAINDDPSIDIASTLQVNENQTAVTTVQVSDVDSEDTLTLTLSGTDSESFNLSDDRVLTFKEAPDYETKNSYVITLSLTDGTVTVTKEVTIEIVNSIEITAETNININENVQTADYNITDAGGSSVNLEIVRDYGKDFTPTNTIGNSDGSNFVLGEAFVINNGEIYQALSDIQIGTGASITIKAGGKLISRYVEVDGSYSRPSFTNGVTYSNTYGEGVVLVSPDNSNFEEENSVGNQNILIFDGGSFKVEGTKDNPAEIRNISVAFATDESSDNASVDINYLNWRGGSLHPFFFKRTNAQSSNIYGSLKLTNSYLTFVNSVNVMRLDRRNQSGDIVIEDNVFHNSGGFSLDFNYQTSGLLRIQRNLYFGEDVYRTNKPAFLSIGITGGTSQQYPKHTDDRTKVLFKDNAILATPNSSKAIYCEGYDPYVPWEGNYFGYRADFENTVRKTITDKSTDLSKTCSYPNSLILLESPRTWDVRPDFYFTEDDKIIMDVPVDYESATNKVIPFNIKATNSNEESKVLDMQMTVIDVDEPAEPIISDILDQISVQENTVFVSNFSVQSDSNDSVTISLSGDDADKFEVSSNNLLSFKTAPNYEVPTDTDSDNVYKVTIVASTGSTSASMNIDVSVTNAIEESNAPTFSAFTSSTTSVDVSSSSQDITFSLRVQDESGSSYQRNYGSVALYASGFSASSITNNDDNAWTLKSGDDKDGIWEVTLTVPQGQLSGDYYFYSGAFRDVNGAYTTCTTNYTDTTRDGSCGTYQLITVDNGAESNAPTFSAFTSSTTSVDVSSSSQDITFSLRVQDESGSSYQRNYGSVALYASGFSASSITNNDDNAWTLKSGDDKDGIWEVTLTVPQGQLSGDYYFYSGAFRDVNGAYTTCTTNYTDTTRDGSCGTYQLITITNDASSSTIYYLYGGSDGGDYLGSYGGSNTASDSICNSVGTYGSNVSSSSIWNTVGSYGSTVGTYSPWNSVSSSPPEFFTQDKSSSYGKFTINTATANRTTVTKLTNIIDYFNNNSSNIAATRDYACSNANTSPIITSLKPLRKISKVKWVD